MRNRIALALLLTTAMPALAHVTLTERGALPGAHYVAHFRVGHGCSGSPTIALRIELPDSVSGIAPEKMPGWTLRTETSGGRINAVTWSGGSLPAAEPGTFAMAMTLPAAVGALYFPATQTCAKGSEQWSELPAPDGHPLKNPAPVLTVSPTPAKTPDNSMPGMKM